MRRLWLLAASCVSPQREIIKMQELHSPSSSSAAAVPPVCLSQLKKKKESEIAEEHARLD